MLLAAVLLEATLVVFHQALAGIFLSPVLLLLTATFIGLFPLWMAKKKISLEERISLWDDNTRQLVGFAVFFVGAAFISYHLTRVFAADPVTLAMATLPASFASEHRFSLDLLAGTPGRPPALPDLAQQEEGYWLGRLVIAYPAPLYDSLQHDPTPPGI